MKPCLTEINVSYRKSKLRWASELLDPVDHCCHTTDQIKVEERHDESVWRLAFPRKSQQELFHQCLKSGWHWPIQTQLERLDSASPPQQEACTSSNPSPRQAPCLAVLRTAAATLDVFSNFCSTLEMPCYGFAMFVYWFHRHTSMWDTVEGLYNSHVLIHYIALFQFTPWET